MMRPTTATGPRSTGTWCRSSAPTTGAGPSPSTASRYASTAGSSRANCRPSTPSDPRPVRAAPNRARQPSMLNALILVAGLALPGQGSSKADPDQFPLALHRSMEIDDLDREIQRLHDTVIMQRSQLGSTQRLAQRGAASRSDIERELASLRYEEAREVETRAYREIKVYERDVNGHAL